MFSSAWKVFATGVELRVSLENWTTSYFRNSTQLLTRFFSPFLNVWVFSLGLHSWSESTPSFLLSLQIVVNSIPVSVAILKKRALITSVFQWFVMWGRTVPRYKLHCTVRYRELPINVYWRLIGYAPILCYLILNGLGLELFVILTLEIIIAIIRHLWLFWTPTVLR